MPMNTAVREPRIASSGWPALSIACQATSISSRCWGSMQTASRGEMPKKAGSN